MFKRDQLWTTRRPAGVFLVAIMMAVLILTACAQNEVAELLEHKIELVNDTITTVPGLNIDPVKYALSTAYDTQVTLSIEIRQGQELFMTQAIEKTLLGGQEVIFSFQMTSLEEGVVILLNFADTSKTINLENFLDHALGSQGTIVNRQEGLGEEPIINYSYQIQKEEGVLETWQVLIKLQEKIWD